MDKKSLIPLLSPKVSLRLLQIILGATFIIHGTKKLIAGKEQWQFLGEQLNLLGIDFYPVFFGLTAALSELLGGVLLVSGYFTRIASLFLIGTMTVALLFMIHDTGAYSSYAYPLTNLLVLLVFFFSPSKRFNSK